MLRRGGFLELEEEETESGLWASNLLIPSPFRVRGLVGLKLVAQFVGLKLKVDFGPWE